MAAHEQEENDDWLDDEPAVSPATQASSESKRPPHLMPWKVLVVDDEPDIHSITNLALRNVEYKGRKLELLSAYSGKEALEVLNAHNDIALILLDVVMETDDSGLKLVHMVRNELENHLSRIVLRTGQPGSAPEQEVILSYDINDYKAKAELTSQKLYTTVIASLRAYESLVIIERNRQGLNKILEGSANLYELRSLREFASGVLNQVSAVLEVGNHGILCMRDERFEEKNAEVPQLQLLAATGVFSDLVKQDQIDPSHPMYTHMLRAVTECHHIYDHPTEVLYFSTQARREFVIYFAPPWPLSAVDRTLLEVFCNRISVAFDNLYYNTQMRCAQEATVVALADLAEYRDSDTGEHVMRVQRMTSAIVERMAQKHYYPETLSSQFIELVGMASILHDVGKVSTPDNILFKPGRHTPEERVIMEQHAPNGAAILTKAANLVEGLSFLSLGAEIAGGHHEHFDGNGYPQKLAGEIIPLAARVVAVVDVFDALMHKRPYKEPWLQEDALQYVRERSGTQFDPKVVDAFLELVAENHPDVIIL